MIPDNGFNGLLYNGLDGLNGLFDNEFFGYTKVTVETPLCDENGHPIKGILRHPLLEDDVIIYANSTILGRVTIGRGAIIGGNVWVTEDVPAGARVMQSKKKSL